MPITEQFPPVARDRIVHLAKRHAGPLAQEPPTQASPTAPHNPKMVHRGAVHLPFKPAVKLRIPFLR